MKQRIELAIILFTAFTKLLANRVGVYITLLLILTGATISAHARNSTCSGVTNTPGPKSTTVMEEVTYFSSSTSNFDSRATGKKVELRGLLYYKQAQGQSVAGRPVLIYNHGHNAEREEPCAIVDFFTGQGWIVFAPLRRGHSYEREKGKRGVTEVRSTGLHIDEYADKCMRVNALESLLDLPELYCSSKHCRPDVPCGMNFKRNAIELGYLNDQRADVREQISYINLRPALGRAKPGMKLADSEQITVVGHSYGGTLIVMTNKHDFGQNVMIDISGAELSWGADEPYWQLDMVFAMQDQKRPIYFLQPKNGRTLEPTNVLSKIATQKNLPSKAEIFPPACKEFESNPNCKDVDFKEAHGSFILQDHYVEKWGPTVIEFSNKFPRTGSRRRQS